MFRREQPDCGISRVVLPRQHEENQKREETDRQQNLGSFRHHASQRRHLLYFDWYRFLPIFWRRNYGTSTVFDLFCFGPHLSQGSAYFAGILRELGGEVYRALVEEIARRSRQCERQHHCKQRSGRPGNSQSVQPTDQWF